ncbi:unnamed protein product [Staurois parvus]|uniref:Uncharacterized protein n=1 Tax=Staurois parvus TaxID=386267 RepID=A0ABN9DNI8_9NEOB|nr:unnamed protein product [Staurois parvus]
MYSVIFLVEMSESNQANWNSFRISGKIRFAAKSEY